MLYKELSDKVLDAVFAVHKGLGPGLLELPYQNALFNKLCKAGLQVEKEVPFPVYYILI